MRVLKTSQTDSKEQKTYNSTGWNNSTGWKSAEKLITVQVSNNHTGWKNVKHRVKVHGQSQEYRVNSGIKSYQNGVLQSLSLKF